MELSDVQKKSLHKERLVAYSPYGREFNPKWKIKSKAIEGQDQIKVNIRRQWNEWRIAEVDFTKLSNIAWYGILELKQPLYVRIFT
jgi:hypothetical protein